MQELTVHFSSSFQAKKHPKAFARLDFLLLDGRETPSISQQFLYCILRVQQSKILL